MATSSSVPAAPVREVPGPRGAPVLGSALQMRRDPLGGYLRAMLEHGDVVRFAGGVGGLRVVFYAVFHPDGVQRVLARAADGYRKDNVFYEEVRWALGDGLLNSQGDQWLAQKRLLQPLFTRRRIAEYVADMADETARVVARWQPVAARGGTVDLHEAMIGLSLRVVARSLFGADAERILQVVRHAFPVLGDYTLRRGFAPVRIPRSWPTPGNRRAARAQRAIHQVCDALIAERRARPARDDDLLDLLLQAGAGGGAALDDVEIRDQVLIFLLAGHDTTGLALTFALDLLGRHPDQQRRVRDEARAVLAGAEPTAEVVGRLGFTTMVLKEAMRLYPPAYAFGRRTSSGDVIDGHEIPPGADVYVSPWATHRHPAFWPDAERFDPGRFTPEREHERHPYAHVPFGGGPRGCIGRHFSMLEATLALAVIVSAYEVAAVAPPVTLAPRITLHPAAPVLSRLTPA
jgi:cytochrome P450